MPFDSPGTIADHGACDRIRDHRIRQRPIRCRDSHRERGERLARVGLGRHLLFYDPERNRPENQRLPFVTLVIHDYPGWDTASQLDRDGIFRVNIAIGRSGFERLLGYPPAQHEAHHDEFDYALTDVLISHPMYASQGWVSIVNPAAQTSMQLHQLLEEAHALAVRRHARRQDAHQT